MNRSQRKCLAVSTALHVGLLSSVVLVSAFRSAAPSALEFQPIEFTPVITTFENMSGGGNPNGQAPQPPPPPAPVMPRRPEPAPPETAPESRPKAQEESLTPSTHPTRKRPQIDTTTIVTRPRNQKSKTKPKENEEDSQAQDRDQAKAAAEARRRLAQALGQAASQIGDSRSGPVSVEWKGPGGGGLPYANFYQAVQSIYYREWIIPEGAADSDATTEAEILVARDGAVVSAAITRSSGNAVVDQSVQLTLDRVRQVPPLPPNCQEDKIPVTINFKARPQSKG